MLDWRRFLMPGRREGFGNLLVMALGRVRGLRERRSEATASDENVGMRALMRAPLRHFFIVYVSFVQTDVTI
jgi:hypothetical protein